jgi:hypothetical protein
LTFVPIGGTFMSQVIDYVQGKSLIIMIGGLRRIPNYSVNYLTCRRLTHPTTLLSDLR